MILTELADVLRRGGVQVVEEPGWQRRGHGELTDVKTIVCHHTGGTKDMRVIIDGRPDLAGPLAHIWLARDGVWHVTAAGLCWHAGAVRDPSYSNWHAIGIEAEATGKDAWPAIQYESYAKGCAALARWYGVDVSRVLGHKEVCAPPGRKNDPNFDMDVFRTRVRAYLTAPARKPEEDDMPTPADVADYLLKFKIGEVPVSTALAAAAQSPGRFTALEADVAQVQAGLTELTAAVKALSAALAPPATPGAGG